MPFRIVPAQIRGARGMLDWTMLDLAQAAGVSVSTVKRMEMMEPRSVSGTAYDIVRNALETEGVEFLDDDGGGPGMRLRNR